MNSRIARQQLKFLEMVSEMSIASRSLASKSVRSMVKVMHLKQASQPEIGPGPMPVPQEQDTGRVVEAQG